MGVLGIAIYLNLIQGIQNLHEGDCLTFSQIQQVLDVENPEFYQGGTCEKTFKTNETLGQTLTCHLSLPAGEWHRQMIKHDEPGIFLFTNPPCYDSVEFASFEHTTYTDITD